jgi:hypothetical protein
MRSSLSAGCIALLLVASSSAAHDTQSTPALAEAGVAAAPAAEPLAAPPHGVEVGPGHARVADDVHARALVGRYAANADRNEDWITDPQPLRDRQQPFNGVPPLSSYPSGPLSRDTTGNFLVTGQIADAVAAHTASGVPVSAHGPGSSQFTGVMDKTDLFFKAMQALVAGVPPRGDDW